MVRETTTVKPIRRAAVTGLFALWLAPLPALAESQSSNSSSNCSNGRCSRVESYVIEDRSGREGWMRVERWREGQGWTGPRAGRDDDRRAPRNQPRRGRDDDDDDRDDD
jgi:hypothetical protein